MGRRINIRVLFLGVMLFTISMLIYTSHLRETQTPDQRTLQDFYHRTKSAMDKGDSTDGTKNSPPIGGTVRKEEVDLDSDGDIDDEDARLAREMADRLKKAEQQAKDLANAKAPNKPDLPSKVIGVGSSANGQKKAGSDVDGAVGETDEQHAVEAELDAIVKKAPVIIFSKSYCPYSKRAKSLLLEKYDIKPAPVVVELDTHPLGPALQSRLGELTGRRTVPNILISGKSIGGSDDIADLDRDKLLVDRIKSLGGKSVEMKERIAA